MWDSGLFPDLQRVCSDSPRIRSRADPTHPFTCPYPLHWFSDHCSLITVHCSIHLLFFFILVMIFFFIPVKLSWGFQARVIGVQDGNTIRVLHSGHLDFVGLYGVLAPEKDQPFGQKAIQFLSSLLVDRDVEITPVKVVRDGHMYGIIAVDGKSVNRQMIAFGLGWVDIDNCSKPECREWITLQDRVGPSAKGIWSLAPIRPDEKPKFVKIEMRCRKCGRIHKLYLLFGNDPRLTAPARKDGYSPFPESNTIICSCGAKVDLTRFRREVEANYRQ